MEQGGEAGETGEGDCVVTFMEQGGAAVRGGGDWLVTF
jgi:hypothetical protein